MVELDENHCKLSYENQDLPDMLLQKSKYYTCQTPL